MHSFYLKITYTVFIWANFSLSSLANSCSQQILTGNSELMGTGIESINVDLCLLEFSSCAVLHKGLLMHGEMHIERGTEISDCSHLFYQITIENKERVDSKGVRGRGQQRLACPPLRGLPHPGIKPRSLELQADSLPPEPSSWKPNIWMPWVYRDNRNLTWIKMENEPLRLQLTFEKKQLAI